MDLKKIGRAIYHLLDDDPPGTPMYDPVHVGAVIVGTVLGFGVLYWLLWALLVCEGGLFMKVGPFLEVVFTSKTLKDFGYLGYPYELGLFEGWIVNLSALVLSGALVVALWWVAEGPHRAPKISKKETSKHDH